VNPILVEGRALILIPARNEEGAIGNVVSEVRSLFPTARTAVTMAGGSPRLHRQAEGARVLSAAISALGRCRPIPLAFEMGFHYVVRIDGDKA
jgi:hypothetical protein